MTKHNPANERIKRAYFVYLREARRRNDASIDGVAKALARFEEATGHRDFGKFHREQAVAFKRKLDQQTALRSGPAAEPGHGQFDPGGIAQLFHLAGRSARLQTQDQLFRRGLFQPVGKGRANRQGRAGKALPHGGAGQSCPGAARRLPPTSSCATAP